MHFGTVQSFNETTGYGFIHPENLARDLSFERSEILAGCRASYKVIIMHEDMPTDRSFSATQEFISRENMRWFKQQLEACTDDAKRDQLQKLLATANAQLQGIKKG